MILVLDANIVFSSILKPQGIVASILLDSENGFIFIAPEFLKAEIKKHTPRLSVLTGFDQTRISSLIDFIFSRILFYANEVIPENIQLQADDICNSIDPKDSIYIAFSLFFQSKVWSGDKKLYEGLKNKGVDLLINTNELAIVINSLRK
jgi:predicted nucleic acid-binding protein